MIWLALLSGCYLFFDGVPTTPVLDTGAVGPLPTDDPGRDLGLVIRLGDGFACSRLDDLESSTLHCWQPGGDLVGWLGANDVGAFGIGAWPDGTPIAMAWRESFGGTLWTLSRDGQGSSIPWTDRPQEISVGRGHACLRDGRSSAAPVRCWGENALGQVGQPPGTRVSSPTAPVRDTPTRAIAAFGRSTCIADADGAVWCAGLAGGDGEVWRAMPDLTDVVALSGAAGPPLEAVGDAPTEAWELCARRADATVSCANQAFPEGAWYDVSAAAGYACGVGPAGDVTCVGDARGVSPTGLPPVAHVYVAADQACALTGDNEVWCWGGEPWSAEARLFISAQTVE